MKESWKRLGLTAAALLLALLMAEGASRLAFGPLFGWQYESPLPKRIQEARQVHRQHPVIGVFGDSIVEYYRGSKANMVAVANRETSDDARFVNFGFSGTAIPDYLVTFERGADAGVLDAAIFVIYTGNDYYGYRFQYLSGEDLTRPARERGDPHLWANGGTVTNWLKHSVFLHSLWRVGIKGTLGLFTGDDLRNHTLNTARAIGASPQILEARMAALSPELKREADRDLINKSLLTHVLLNPDLYLQLRQGFGDEEAAVGAALRRDVRELAKACRERGIPCGVLFVDSPVLVDARYHPFYREMGCHLPEGVVGEPHHTRLIKPLLAELGLPAMDTRDLMKDGEAYLPRDEHPSPHGHALLGGRLLELADRLHSADPTQPTGTDSTR